MAKPIDRPSAGTLAHRYHGRLSVITDSERRALRPIGTTAYEVAARTGMLLADLVALPSVRIFQGVRPLGTDLPRVPHAISAGRRLVLVESVAWPPGRYDTAPTGRIHCDGRYIGQSILPLITAVQAWQKIMPYGHRVSATVVVHPTGAEHLALPDTAAHVNWVHAENAVHDLRRRLSGGRQAVSASAMAALLAAVPDRE